MTLDVTVAEVERFYGGLNPAEAPLYTFAAASRYIGVPVSTVRWWARGRVRGGYEAVLALGPGSSGLSFWDLLELHAIGRLRKVHGIELEAIRRAVRFAEQELDLSRLLLREDLSTFGGNIFIEHLGDLVGISAGGQIAMREIIERYLSRVDRDASRMPIRYYPDFAGVDRVPGSKPVAISPLVAFGKPTVSGTGIHTAVIASRVDAGESLQDIALDYDLSLELVRSAVIYENAA